jgi:hypothetical protein
MDIRPPLRKWTTVIPIHNLDPSLTEPIEFSGGLVLTGVPAWVHKDSMLKEFGRRDLDSVKAAKYAFAVEYEAEALGSPDPAWKGKEPRSIQDSQRELALLASLALWLSRPSPVCLTLIIHAPHHEGKPFTQQIERQDPVLHHPREAHVRMSAGDLRRASMLHSKLIRVRRNTAVWTALRATFSALQMYAPEIRYALFWIALEALFGPTDGREITFRLSQRMAFFLATTRAGAKETVTIAKKAYAFRSKVVHGNWTLNPQMHALMGDTETIARSCLVHLAENDELIDLFMTNRREAYLDDLAFAD